MNMLLASKLKSVFPIPDKTHCAVADEAQWAAVEEKLGLQLPTDYKMFIGIYGTGYIGDFIILYNPFSTDKMVNLFYSMEWILEGERQLRPLSPIKLPLHPEQGGLLPFAKTYDGDRLYWQTQGEPDNWTLFLQEVRSSDYEQYAMNMTDFFIKLVSHPKKNNPFLKRSRIMRENFNPKKPFVSLWVNLEKTFGNLKEELKKISRESNGAISQVVLENLLKRYGFDFETDELNERLHLWQQEQFIELLGTSEVYLRVINKHDQ
jgi:hypothetical protein